MQPLITPQQRELVPLRANISGVTREQRKNVEMRFGYPVPLRHNKPRVGASRDRGRFGSAVVGED